MLKSLSAVASTIFIALLSVSCAEKAVAPEVCLDVKNKAGRADFFVGDTVFISNCGESAPYTAVFTGQQPNVYGSKGVVTVSGMDGSITSKEVVTAVGLNLGADQRIRVIYTIPGTKEIVLIVTDVKRDGTDLARSEKRTVINVNP